MKKFVRSGICGVVLTMSPAAHGRILIDDFQSPEVSVGASAGPGTSVIQTQSGVGSLSGDRTFHASLGSRADGGAIVSDYNATGDRARFFADHLNAFGPVSFSAGLTWGGVQPLSTPDFTASLGKDFNFVLSVPFIVNFTSAEANLDVDLTLTDGSGNTQTVAVLLPRNATVSTTLEWHSDEYSQIDFSDLQKIDLSMSGILPAFNNFSVAFSNFQVNSLTPVPEPEEYAVMAGFALVGFGLWRRQRSR